jgi:hypothetical protein
MPMTGTWTHGLHPYHLRRDGGTISWFGTVESSAISSWHKDGWKWHLKPLELLSAAHCKFHTPVVNSTRPLSIPHACCCQFHTPVVNSTRSVFPSFLLDLLVFISDHLSAAYCQFHTPVVNSTRPLSIPHARCQFHTPVVNSTYSLPIPHTRCQFHTPVVNFTSFFVVVASTWFHVMAPGSLLCSGGESLFQAKSLVFS